MNHIWKRATSFLLMVALIVTLIPYQASAQTSVSLKIENLETSSTRPTQPTKVTSETIDITFNYNNIADENLGLLYYEITHVESDTMEVVKTKTAAKLGPNQAYFQGVQLNEGLNKITLVYEFGSNPKSVPAWVHFTNNSSIGSLSVDGDLLVNGGIYPKDNDVNNNTFFIEGTSRNLTNLDGFTTLQPTPQSPYYLNSDGAFGFQAGEDSDYLLLRPGDNDLKVKGYNATSTYQTDRKFAYNNGKSFLFNTMITSQLTNLKPSDLNLFRQPTFEALTGSGPYLYEIETDVKINRSAVDDMTHNIVSLEVNNSGNPVQIEFTNVKEASNSVTYTVYQSGNTGVTTTLNVSDQKDYYIIEDVKISNIAIDTTRTDQVLDVTFNPSSAVYVEDNQQFIYYYSNKNQPYVEKVQFDDANGMQLYDGQEISINSNEVTFYVTVKQGATEVNIRLPYLNNKLVVKAPVTGGAATIKVDKKLLPEGLSAIQFVPVLNGNEVLVGAKQYMINYNPAPYIAVKNIYYGEVFTSNKVEPKGVDGSGNAFDGPVFQFKPVNIVPDKNGKYDILVKLNENVDTVRSSDYHYVNGKLDEFRFFFGAKNASRSNWKLIDGVNILTFEIYPQGTLNGSTNPGGVLPITTSTYKLSYFTDEIPNVSYVDLETKFAENNVFVQPNEQAGTYYTQEKSLKFETSIVHAKEIEFIYKGYDEDGDPFREVDVYKWNGSGFIRDTINSNEDIIDTISNVTPSPSNSTAIPTNGSAIFKSEILEMYDAGTYTVEVNVMSEQGLTASGILEIIRQPADFIVHYPIIDPVTKEGVVNGNYTRVYLEAEGADKIIYNKKQELDEIQEIEINNVDRDLFVFDVYGLKAGDNDVDITIVRGDEEVKEEIILINADTTAIGAVHKESIEERKLDAFDKQVKLEFEKGTVMLRKRHDGIDQSLSPLRDVLIGIADPIDGRVNKTIHPYSKENSVFESVPSIKNLLKEQTGRFRMASPLYWIDGGMYNSSNSDLAIYDGGIYPYERDEEFYTRNNNNLDEVYYPSEAGELTLAYDPNMVQNSWRYVTVYHYGYNENYTGAKRYEWKNIGGVVDEKKNTITVPFEEFGYYTVMYMYNSFSDVTAHPWARDYLDTLYAKGLMKNKQTTLMVPNDPINRGEFSTMLVKALQIPLNYDNNPTFYDVGTVNPSSGGLYEYKYIETAARAGIIRGIKRDLFQPNANITREQVAMIIARAMDLDIEYNPQDMSKINDKLSKLYTDVNSMNDYAKAAILAVTKDDLMTGIKHTTSSSSKDKYYFAPKENMTRAEAASVIMNVLLENKSIPNL
ncbi:S-layer homology domain-containing protein [Longirhabdus pacifica]|uniref:S-layer homology domain-containing protein n=1 Tax=Longirhabdus pacifica TaxID=2305227 RepID=UPI00100916EE|nr:S-layer homology domain-containing protein [Longirhabdus pacifica]